MGGLLERRAASRHEGAEHGRALDRDSGEHHYAPRPCSGLGGERKAVVRELAPAAFPAARRSLYLLRGLRTRTRTHKTSACRTNIRH
jgi:hypothetical protein